MTTERQIEPHTHSSQSRLDNEAIVTLQRRIVELERKSPKDEINKYVAPAWKRLVAHLCDGVILSIFYLIGTMGEGPFIATLFIGVPTILYLVLPIWPGRGMTAGKQAMDLAVVNAETGKKIGVGQALARHVAKLTLLIFWPLLFIHIPVVLFRKDSRGIDDLIATTVVVEDSKFKAYSYLASTAAG